MTIKHISNVALLGLTALSLSGCVAAAIPIVAGGAIVRTSTDGEDAITNAQLANSADVKPSTKAEVAPTKDIETRAITPTPVEASESVGVAPVAPVTPMPGAFDAFIRYAAAAKLAVGTPLSAVLRDPVALDGKRASCTSEKTAVMLDLDMGGTSYSPGMKLYADPDLMLGLGELRAQGIQVAWLSSAPAAYAGDLRMALRSSGLDALGRDPLLLMRKPDDRKQTRRKEFAAETCLIAIAGDQRPDFDERYKYLRNPDDAAGLDVLIGNGWFLAPSPIISSSISPASTAAKEAQ